MTPQKEITNHSSSKTELKDRTLWFDGDSSFKSDDLLRVLHEYDVKYIDIVNEAVRELNRHSSKEQELRVKTKVRPLSMDWNIPEQYAKMDVKEYVLSRLAEKTEHLLENDFDKRAVRVLTELKMYETRGLFSVLRTIIFVINTLTEAGAVWGVGRGSSVSSYVLYLIGAHDVDSFAYNLDIEDFLHD